MVGEDLLVLPVYTEGDTEITGYFPKENGNMYSQEKLS